MHRYSILAVCIFTATLIAHPASAAPPNVVFIMTDNHSPWTLGCYGNTEIRTPNIDRLADQGILFANSYSSNAVCSPTRATYLTGLMPSQHGVHCYLAGGNAQIGPDAYNTLEEFRTLPQIFAESGYVCGLTGKWHLGDNLHPQEGFTYWVTKPHGHTSTFYDAEIIEDGKIRKEPTYLTDFWTNHALRFIDQNKEKPFFLLLAYNGPYGLGGLLDKPARNRHGDFYADKPLVCFPRGPVHPWLRTYRQYVNKIEAMRRYAAEVSGVDDGVGRVMEKLDQLGLADNTLVIFTADQGMSGGQNGLWGMGDHTRPLNAFDGTMHVPLIYRWPGNIPAGKRTDIQVSNYDLMTSVLNLLGMGKEMPTEPPSPGRDYSPVLRGQDIEWDNVTFYEFENTRTIRLRDWKLTRRIDGPNELYHLLKDPGERWNLFHDPGYANTLEELDSRWQAFFGRYVEPKYDLWKDGGSKSILLTMPSERRLPSPKK